MFDNLAECFADEIPFSQAEDELYAKFEKSPTLAFFPSDKNDTSAQDSDETPKQRKAKQTYDKASLLRLIQEIVLAHNNPQHLHYARSERFLVQMNTSGGLKTLVSQFAEFQRHVMVETIFILQTYNFSAISDPAYASQLFTVATSAPSIMKDLFAFTVLQLLQLRRTVQHAEQAPVTFSKETTAIISDDDLYLPILFAQTLTMDQQGQTNQLLRQNDIFRIILDRWVKPASLLFRKPVLEQVYSELHQMFIIFFRLFKQDIPPAVMTRRVLPILSITIRHWPQSFLLISKYYNVFAQKGLRFVFENVIPYTAAACSSVENAKIIMANLTTTTFHQEILLKTFFTQLRVALSEIVQVNLTDESKGALDLLQRLLKRLPFNIVDDLLTSFAEFQGQPDDPCTVFLAFIAHFLDHPDTQVNATRCLRSAAVYYPKEVMDYFDRFLAADANGNAHMMRILGNSSKAVCALMSAARSMLSYNFAIGDQTIPRFMLFMAHEFFQDSIYKRFESPDRRWKALTALFEGVYDLCLCRSKESEELQNDKLFVRALLNAIQAGSKYIQERGEPASDSAVSRFDVDRLWPVLRFECTAIYLMIHLVTFNLTKMKSLSYLCECFFDETSDSSALFSIFVSFLEVSHPLAANLRLLAVKMIGLLCEVAGRKHSINVDAFYPRDRQAVLIESVKQNLIKADDVDQAINELDFISHALLTQKPFAYAFIRRLGSSFVTAVAKEKMLTLANQDSDLFLSVTRLMSHMWRQLNTDAKVIQAISGSQRFWDEAKQIMCMDTDDVNIIASKAYLLHCFLCDRQVIGPECLQSLLQQCAKLPESPERYQTTEDVDYDSFDRVELYRKYGTEFYIDTKLLARRVSDRGIVEQAEKVNVILSKIDAITQVLAALFAVYTNRDVALPELGQFIAIITPMCENDIYPDSSVLLAFRIVDHLITQAQSEEVPILGRSDIHAFINFANKRPLDEVFTITAKLFSAAVVDDDGIGGLGLLFEAVAVYTLANKSTAGINYLEEIALKLTGHHDWLRDNSHSVLIKHIVMELLNTDLGVDVLDLLRIICTTPECAQILVDVGIFQYLADSDNLACTGSPKSPQWPAFFLLLATLPPATGISVDFIERMFSFIVFFLKPHPTALKELTNEQLALVQSTIVRAIEAAGDRLQEHMWENPHIFESIRELLTEKMKYCVIYLRESPHIRMKGTVLKWDSHSEKLSYLIMVTDALSLFNKLYRDPHQNMSDVVKFTDAVIPETMLLDQLEKIMEVLDSLLSIESESYFDIIVRCAAQALRIYGLQSIRFNNAVNMENGRQIIENRESVKNSSRALSAVAQKLGKANLAAFIDGIVTFLSRLT